jgi:hypothetical protein
MVALFNIIEWDIGETLTLNVVFSVLSCLASYYFIKNYIPIFILRGLFGGDKCKVAISFLRPVK